MNGCNYMIKNRYYLVTLLVLAIDYLTKWIVRENLDPRAPVEIIRGFLRFSYWENSGVAFGLFDSVTSDWKPYILAAMAIIAVAIIFLYSVHVPADRKLLHIALAIMSGGILGNFLDRIIRGYVVDFIDFHIFNIFAWPTFNAADSAITIGIALLLIDTVKDPDREEEVEQAAVGGSR